VNYSRRSLPRAHASNHVHVPVQIRALRDASALTFAHAHMISAVMWSEQPVEGQPSGLEPGLALEVPRALAVAVHKGLVVALVQGSVLQPEEAPNHRTPYLHPLLSVKETIVPNHQLSHPHNLRVLAKEVPAHSRLILSHLVSGDARQSPATLQPA
jgi:hypothetical protein